MTDDGYCHCNEPLTDSDVGGEGDDSDDFCWKCKRLIEGAD